jgi:hypothetical protein
LEENMAREIELTRGMKALVDDDMYEELSRFKWRVRHSWSSWYAMRHGNNGKSFDMHRVVLGLTHGDGIQVDHIDGNGLNNQRSNLRICSNTENQRNRRVGANNTSGFKGVDFHKHSGTWRARISIDGRRVFLGAFDNSIDAARAYNKAAITCFGEFARLNEIPE